MNIKNKNKTWKQHHFSHDQQEPGELELILASHQNTAY